MHCACILISVDRANTLRNDEEYKSTISHGSVWLKSIDAMLIKVYTPATQARIL